MPTPTLHVRIISPQQLILDTQAEAVSSRNLYGPFDVLALHANFITVIENQPIVVRIPKQKPLVFKFEVAIMLVMENKVNIYTYIKSNTQPKP